MFITFLILNGPYCWMISFSSFYLLRNIYQTKHCYKLIIPKQILKGGYWSHHVWLVTWLVYLLWSKYTPQLMKNKCYSIICLWTRYTCFKMAMKVCRHDQHPVVFLICFSDGQLLALESYMVLGIPCVEFVLRYLITFRDSASF